MYALVNPTFTVVLSYGELQCSSLNLQASVILTVVSCNGSALVVNAGSITAGGMWMSMRVVNWGSVRADNMLTLDVKEAAPASYTIGSGSVSISLTANNQSFTITNSNPTFAAATTFTIQ
jgi:hypothetical protein